MFLAGDYDEMSELVFNANEKKNPKLLSNMLLTLVLYFQIFKAVVFEIHGQTKQTRSKAVKNLRQHACSGLVKMCTKYLDLIFVSMD